jgi:hypothetical protein
MSGSDGRAPRPNPEPVRTGPPSSLGSPDSPDSARSLAELVLAIVGQLPDVSRVDDDDGAVWRRAGRAFASLAGDALEVRLQAPVARAALRTPDTRESPRGEEWVRFAPSELHRFAADRAAAWLESAWRHAAE